jgi:hypothetical protein
VHLGPIIFFCTLSSDTIQSVLLPSFESTRSFLSQAGARCVNRPSCARFETTDYQGENKEESKVKGFLVSFTS